MLRKRLIPGTSLRASEIALGVMPWGTRIDVDQAERLYDLYRAAGGDVLDTAHIYAAWEPHGAGASEKALGEVLRRAGDRRQVVIISKGGHPREPFYPRPDRFLSPDLLLRDVQESLDRLGLQTIDLYFLHRDDRRVPPAEIVDAMERLVSAGWIRYYAASNWGVDRIEQVNRIAAERGTMGFVASQPQFSLAHPNALPPETDPGLRFLTDPDRAWHERTGLPAFCYSPTAQGYFASGGKRAAKEYDNPISRGRLQRATQLAAQLGATVTQVVLAYILAHPFPAIPIVGTTDAEHLRDALGAAELRLDAQQVRRLRDGD